MKRIKLALLPFLALALLLGGCSSGGMTNASAPQASGGSSPAYDREVSENMSSDYGYPGGGATDGGETAPTAPPTAPSPSPEEGTSLPGNTKLIYTADMTLESTEFEAAVSGLQALVAEVGGYFERNETHNYSGGYRSAYYVVRVPAEQFNSFCTKAGELCAQRYFSSNAQDISEQYYDTEVRLATQRTKYDRLLDLLSKATNMKDIISLEGAIGETEYMIEQLTGSLRRYDSLVGYSSVTINLSEVYRLTTEDAAPISFGERLSSSLRSGFEDTVDSLERLVLFVARNLIGLVLFAAVVVVALAVLRRSVWKTRKSSHLPPAPPQTPPTPPVE